MNMSMWRKYFHVQVVHVFHIGLLRDPILEILPSVSTVPLTILYDQLCQGGKNLSNLYLYIYTCELLWSSNLHSSSLPAPVYMLHEGRRYGVVKL